MTCPFVARENSALRLASALAPDKAARYDNDMTDDTKPWSERDAHWHRIIAAPLDGPGDVPLAERVDTPSDALFTEYRKFLRLAQMFPEQVTPPPAVQEIWQIHTGTAGWRALDVPEYNAHAGRGDMSAFTGRYLMTRRAYTKYFGEDPPEPIWPPVMMEAQARGPSRSLFACGLVVLLMAILLPGDKILLKSGLFVAAFALLLGQSIVQVRRWMRDRDV